MKRFTLSIFCAATILACNKSADAPQDSHNDNGPILGGKNDKHGWMSSAGQSWSELKQDCIQIFNQGFRLNPIEIGKDQEVISAFIIYNDDHSKIELFLPDGSDQMILKKVDKNTYGYSNYKYDSNKSILYINGAEKYKGNIE